MRDFEQWWSGIYAIPSDEEAFARFVWQAALASMQGEAVYAVVQYYDDYDQLGGVVRGLYASEESATKSVHHLDRVGYEYSWHELEVMEVQP